MDGIAPPSTSWKPVVILLYDIRMWGGWIPVYQQEQGISTVRITTLPTTYLVCSSAIPSSEHHLCRITLTSYMPVSLFSHSQCADQAHLYNDIKKGVCQPPLIFLIKSIDNPFLRDVLVSLCPV